ncbi:MAG: S1 RNA-binding domain-containing protein [Bacillota bacterium]
MSVPAVVSERRYRWPFPAAEGFRPRPLPSDPEFLWEAKRFRYVLQAPAVACSDGVLELDLGAVRGRVSLEESGCADERELSRLVGQHVACVVLRVERDVAECSRRRALEVMARRSWERFLKPGRDVWAVVRGYAPGGVVVDAGGVRAVVPFRELSPGWVFDARQEFPVGQELRLRVVSTDPEKGELVLSGRPHFRDPWEGVDARYREGGVYAGVVVNEHRGLLFVQLEPGLDACCPRPAFQDAGRGARVVLQLDVVDAGQRRLRGHVLQVLVSPGKLPY